MRFLASLIVFMMAASAAVGGGPRLQVEANHPKTLDGGSTSPVQVVNFPMDEDGSLATSSIAASRVLDLLDQDVSIAPNEYWYSEVFSTSAFNSLAIQVSRLLPTSTGKCRIQWALTADDPFLMGEENKEPVYPYLTDVWVYSAFPADRTALQTVQAPLARVRCSALGGTDTAVISDVKVLLRRE